MDRPVELWTFIAALLVFVTSAVRGEIRCYCNQASCVSTGYMCKSSSACFSDFDSGLHGCVDRQLGCPHGASAHCCSEDMCNYAHVDMVFRTPPVTGALEDDPNTPQDEENTRIAYIETALRRELWFRAAVIATPIAGVCILALLAAAAARLLRQEDRLRRRRPRVYGVLPPPEALLLPWGKGLKGATVV